MAYLADQQFGLHFLLFILTYYFKMNSPTSPKILDLDIRISKPIVLIEIERSE